MDHPYRTMGSTLVQSQDADEFRRVFTQQRGEVLEIIEYSTGQLTKEFYGTEEHHHAVHLRQDNAHDLVKKCFAAGNEYLSDLMDELDHKGEPYGYQNTVAGEYVAFRPHFGNGR